MSLISLPPNDLPTRLMARLRDAAKGPLMLPGATNALTAKQIQAAGFEGVYVSGAGLANAVAGFPDIGLLTLDEVTRLSGYIANAVSLPVIVDADTGFGEAIHVARTVQCFEQEGISGLHLEDQVFPKRCGHLNGKQVIPVEVMSQKIRAAVTARRSPEFLIIARTDAFSLFGMDDALARSRAYLEAGAQMIFPEALSSEAEFAAFAHALRATHPQALLLANMTEFGKSPLLNAKQLGDLGYNAVIYPLTAFRATLAATRSLLAELKSTGTQAPWINRMMTRAELYDLLEYPAYEKLDQTLGGYSI